MLDNDAARGLARRIVEPIARFCLRAGLSADAVTWLGTLGTSTAAIVCYGTGHFLLGVVLVAFFGGADLLDGTMARLSQTTSGWGSFLDSSLDRIADGALLCGFLLYMYSNRAPGWAFASGLIALVAGQVTSYLRAKAEAVGVSGKVGLAERSDRMLILHLAALVGGFGGISWMFLLIAVLAGLSVITVAQRFRHVRLQLTT